MRGGTGCQAPDLGGVSFIGCLPVSFRNLPWRLRRPVPQCFLESHSPMTPTPSYKKPSRRAYIRLRRLVLCFSMAKFIFQKPLFFPSAASLRLITPGTRQCSRATPHNIARVSRQHFQIIVFGVEKYLANASHDEGICQIHLSAPRVPILRPSICQNAVKEIDPVLDSLDEVLPWSLHPSRHEIPLAVRSTSP